jgi:hypothetical protein
MAPNGITEGNGFVAHERVPISIGWQSSSQDLTIQALEAYLPADK